MSLSNLGLGYNGFVGPVDFAWPSLYVFFSTPNPLKCQYIIVGEQRSAMVHGTDRETLTRCLCTAVGECSLGDPGSSQGDAVIPKIYLPIYRRRMNENVSIGIGVEVKHIVKRGPRTLVLTPSYIGPHLYIRIK